MLEQSRGTIRKDHSLSDLPVRTMSDHEILGSFATVVTVCYNEGYIGHRWYGSLLTSGRLVLFAKAGFVT